MKYLKIKNKAIIIGYDKKETVVYSAIISVNKYYDGDHIWDNDDAVIRIQMARLTGLLFDDDGKMIQSFESMFDPKTGSHIGGQARHEDGTVTH